MKITCFPWSNRPHPSCGIIFYILSILYNVKRSVRRIINDSSIDIWNITLDKVTLSQWATYSSRQWDRSEYILMRPPPGVSRLSPRQIIHNHRPCRLNPPPLITSIAMHLYRSRRANGLRSRSGRVIVSALPFEFLRLHGNHYRYDSLGCDPSISFDAR